MTKDEARQELEESFREIVEMIEARPMTTRNRYGDYMDAIASVTGRIESPATRKTMVIVGVMFARVGANVAGVRDALQAMGAFDQ